MKTKKIIMLSLIVLPVIAGVYWVGNTTAQFYMLNAAMLMLGATYYQFMKKAFAKIVAAVRRNLG